MKHLTPLQFVLLVPALLLLLLSLAFAALVLSFAPPLVSVVASVLAGAAILWFVLGRRRGPAAVSEAAFIGQRPSKDGLL